jgi:hypothetical protein
MLHQRDLFIIGGLKMKKFLIQLALVGMGVLFLVSVTQASIVVTFDDLPTPTNEGGQYYGTIPTNYAGLIWNGWEVANGNDYRNVYNNTYLPPTLPNFAYNGSGVMTVTTSNGGLFDFWGAEVSTWAQNDAFQGFSSTTLTVEGYKGNTLVGSYTMNLSSNKYDPFNTNLQNINELVFKNDGVDGHWWILDNFTYDPIPEPAAIIIWSLLGGLGIAIVRRQWRRKAA